MRRWCKEPGLTAMFARPFKLMVGLDGLYVGNNKGFHLAVIFARSSDRIALLINRVPLTIFKLSIYYTPYRLTAASCALVTSG